VNRRAIGAIATLVLVAGLLGPAEFTLARFRDADDVTAGFSTATLRPPSDLVGTGGVDASLTWTPTTSGWGTGYLVLRSATTGSGYGQVGDVTPVGASSTTDYPAAGTWYYVLRTYFHNWTSVRSNEASVVVASAPTSTGLQDCTATEADTGGDGDGYERDAGQGCMQDGSVAQDRSSGTTTSNSCSDAGKDRHRFWGYAFGLPATVTSIDGITVHARLGSNNTMGIEGVCVELSWDGGATWTANQPITIESGDMTTYTVGGASDTWGRTWTAADLAGTSFRVRITDVATVTNRRFDLDWIGVEVDYTP
jgi:hypothetical protein